MAISFSINFFKLEVSNLVSQKTEAGKLLDPT